MKIENRKKLEALIKELAGIQADVDALQEDERGSMDSILSVLGVDALADAADAVQVVIDLLAEAIA